MLPTVRTLRLCCRRCCFAIPAIFLIPPFLCPSRLLLLLPFSLLTFSVLPLPYCRPRFPQQCKQGVGQLFMKKNSWSMNSGILFEVLSSLFLTPFSSPFAFFEFLLFVFVMPLCYPNPDRTILRKSLISF